MQKMAYFYLLKDELLSKYRKEHPSWAGTIHDFKTREIANFQNMLEREVGSKISEKWFYTHIKPLENTKLPRIDTLDLLSEFTGYENWEAFMERHYKRALEVPVLTNKLNKSGSKKVFLIIGAVLGFSLLLSYLFLLKSDVYTICFVDNDSGKAIEEPIELTIFKLRESSVTKTTDKLGCIIFKKNEDAIHFAVSTPYYKRNTIRRSFQNAEQREVIKLKKDDFALMIHLFSNNKLEDWEKRRRQLDKMIADEAIIFQINEDNLGLELYNKTEFINKLTMPINSLKNIRIMDTRYEEKQIVEMRFIQEDN